MATIWDQPGTAPARDPQPRAFPVPHVKTVVDLDEPTALQSPLITGTHVRAVGRQGNPTGARRSRVEEETLRREHYPMTPGVAARLRAATRQALGR